MKRHICQAHAPAHLPLGSSAPEKGPCTFRAVSIQAGPGLQPVASSNHRPRHTAPWRSQDATATHTRPPPPPPGPPPAAAHPKHQHPRPVPASRRGLDPHALWTPGPRPAPPRGHRGCGGGSDPGASPWGLPARRGAEMSSHFSTAALSREPFAVHGGVPCLCTIPFFPALLAVGPEV